MGDGRRSLQIDEDLTFQRHQRRFERLGWLAMGLLLLAALLGLLGDGWLSSATAGGANDPIRVRFERLDRASKPTLLSIMLAPEAAASGDVAIWVSRDWVEGVTIDRIDPEPASVAAAPDRLVYAFAVQAGAGPIEITLRFTHEGWGRVEGEVGLVGGPSQTFRQFVLP
jgi:hypothetical protein